MRKIITAWALACCLVTAWQFTAIDAPRFKNVLVSPAYATCMTLTGVGGANCGGGGGGPTFTAVNAAAKTGCGGDFTCQDSISIGAGFAVVAFQSQGTTTAVTLCGTSLFEVANTGATNDTGMWAGTIAGCGSSNDISFTTNSGFGNMAYAVGLITGLSGSYSSGTPADHSCVGNYPGTQGAPYPCTSSLTVNASGIAVGIGVGGNDFGSGITACSPGSCDIKVTPASGGYASGIWHWTTSGQTPNFTASNNDTAGMLAASWHQRSFGR